MGNQPSSGSPGGGPPRGGNSHGGGRGHRQGYGVPGQGHTQEGGDQAMGYAAASAGYGPQYGGAAGGGGAASPDQHAAMLRQQQVQAQHMQQGAYDPSKPSGEGGDGADNMSVDFESGQQGGGMGRQTSPSISPRCPNSTTTTRSPRCSAGSTAAGRYTSRALSTVGPARSPCTGPATTLPTSTT